MKEEQQEEEEVVLVVVGSSQGSRVMLIPAPHRHTQTKTNVTHSQQHLGVGGGDYPLCCHGNTRFVVFSLSLTWTDVSKHILVKCVQPSQPIAPLQLFDASLRSDQPADNNGLAHMMKNRCMQMNTSPQAHKSPRVCNCTFGLENYFMWIAREMGHPAVFAVIDIREVRKDFVCICLCVMSRAELIDHMTAWVLSCAESSDIPWGQ